MEIVISIIVLLSVCVGFYLGRLPVDEGLKFPTVRLPKRKVKAKVTVTHDAYDGPIEPKAKIPDAKDQFEAVVRGYRR